MFFTIFLERNGQNAKNFIDEKIIVLLLKTLDNENGKL